MKNRLKVTARRDCCILALFTDEDNRELERKIIFIERGRSRSDIQFVLGLYPEFSDLPEQYQDFPPPDMIGVGHPEFIGESDDSYETVRLTRIA
jgi:hypothetical protein